MTDRAYLNEAIEAELRREPAYYHSSQDPLPLGVELRARPSVQFTPSIINRLRPAGRPPRDEHFFMVRDPSCLPYLGVFPEDEYLYRVTPTAQVTRANWDALDLVVQTRSRDIAEDAARRYWTSPSERECANEYLTTSFRVEEAVPYSAFAPARVERKAKARVKAKAKAKR